MAAGEQVALSPFVPEYLQETVNNLKATCRKVIRADMVNVSGVNLFVRVPQLYPRIPKELVEVAEFPKLALKHGILLNLPV